MANVQEMFPGVYHIGLSMDVWATLLVGSERALLVDTGFGVEDLNAVVRSITQLPVDVILSHGHFDHILGACQFDSCFMFEEDLPDFRYYSSPETRRWVLESAADAGIEPEVDLMNARFSLPEALKEGMYDLGGLSAQILHIPGHTPGSAVVLLPQYRLLLSADDWNPCTWLFFERALPVKEYRKNLGNMLKLPFDHVLCSHRSALYPRRMLEDFAAGLTDAALAQAPDVQISPYEHIHTCQLDLSADQMLVFDGDKLFIEENA